MSKASGKGAGRDNTVTTLLCTHSAEITVGSRVRV